MLHEDIQTLKQQGKDATSIYEQYAITDPNIDYNTVVTMYNTPITDKTQLDSKLKFFTPEDFSDNPSKAYEQLEYEAYRSARGGLRLMSERLQYGIDEGTLDTPTIVSLNKNIALTLQVLNTVKRLEGNKSTENISLATFINEIED